MTGNVKRDRRVDSASVRQLALRSLTSGKWDGRHIGLFEANFRAGDEVLLARHLRVLDYDDEQHGLTFNLVDICQAHPLPELLSVMLFVYQTSPCSQCRATTVGVDA